MNPLQVGHRSSSIYALSRAEIKDGNRKVDQYLRVFYSSRLSSSSLDSKARQLFPSLPDHPISIVLPITEGSPPNVCVSGWPEASPPHAVLCRPKSLPEARSLFKFIAEGLIEGNDVAVGCANL